MPADTAQILARVDWSAVLSVAALAVSVYSALYVRSRAKSAERSAEAAENSAGEAALARQDRRAVRFTLDKAFTGVSLDWPRDRAALFRAYGQTANEEPKFQLELHGSVPVQDVVVEMTIGEEPNLEVPEPFREIAKHLGGEILTNRLGEGEPAEIMFDTPSGGTGYPMGQTIRVSFPHMVPGKPRDIRLPEAMTAQLFFRGMRAVQETRRGLYRESEKLVFRVSWIGADGQPSEQTFEYYLYPETRPVYGPGDKIAYLSGGSHIIEAVTARPAVT